MRLYSILILSLIIIISFNYYNNNNNSNQNIDNSHLFDSSSNSPRKNNSLLMYELIEKYSDEYDIPKHVAYNIAYRETRYRGPFHWNYNPHQTSHAGAEGPMQVMPATARGINKEQVDRVELRTDLELNISTSMKLLRYLHDKHGRWDLVCGYYNTGKPIINEYARFCSTNKDYSKNWVKINI